MLRGLPSHGCHRRFSRPTCHSNASTNTARRPTIRMLVQPLRPRLPFLNVCGVSPRKRFFSVATSKPRKVVQSPADDPDQELTADAQPAITATKATSRTTPAMAQFLKMKAEHPGYLLLFRIGDFYETFYEDAVIASQTLGIALTRRDKNSNIPMAGIPFHALDTYLEKLIKKGIIVAICDQVEDVSEAKKGRRLVKREVTRLVTPGTITEERFLPPRAHNFLAAVIRGGEDHVGLAWLDLSTGTFQMTPCSLSTLSSHLMRLDPSEILITEDLLEEEMLQRTLRSYHLTLQQASAFDSKEAASRLCKLYNESSVERLGDFSPLEIRASGALLSYVDSTQKGQVPNLTRPSKFSTHTTMTMDPATRRSLELTKTLTGDRQGSLLGVMDRTVTGSGARLLLHYLNAPLLQVSDINHRLDAVEFFVQRRELLEELRSLLRSSFDIERCMQRISLTKGTPRDLAAIGATIDEASVMKEKLLAIMGASAPESIQQTATRLGDFRPLVILLAKGLVENPPLSTANGGFIAEGFSAELDTLRHTRDNHRSLINNLQTKYRTATGIAQLKLRHNNIVGYYLEIPAAMSSRAPADWTHSQTMVGQMRYRTNELAQLELNINQAAEQALELEGKLFEDLCAAVMQEIVGLRHLAQALAAIDVYSSLALVALERGYSRPVLTNGHEFNVVGGRHVVVEAVQHDRGVHQFVSNDCRMDDNSYFWLLTGPNMGGKSTFLRQNALIAILAQIGSFVPASSAALGVVDAIYSRVGASDDLAGDRSTFMVEMVETAAILAKATPRSLVIMDEIGRGTATFDGLSIAWAVAEHLHNTNHCRTLFATHYHELTCLESSLPCIRCFTIEIHNEEDKVIFLYKVVPGVASRSYGIQVAQLAGLPPYVIARAKEVLARMEGEREAAKPPSQQLTLDSKLEQALREIEQIKQRLKV